MAASCYSRHPMKFRYSGSVPQKGAERVMHDGAVIYRPQFNRQVQELERISEKPTLQALAYALRNPDVWPEDFTWDYRKSSHCAIGLAARLWPKKFPSVSITDVMLGFGLSTVVTYAIFIDARASHRNWLLRGLNIASLSRTQAATNPEDVADMIDTYLKKGMMGLMGLG